MIDIVTVVFQDEIPVLELQAQSIHQYCKNIGIRNIYVVLNQDGLSVNQINPAWWGDLSQHVIVLPRSVFSCEFVENGWVSQQVLKMLTAAISNNVWSMILDAKTVFVRDVQLNQLLDDQGRMQVGTLPVYPVFEPSRKIVNQLYAIDLDQQLGPGGVPFFVLNDLVRLMIAETAVLAQQQFARWFQAQGTLTEFLLYSGYLKYKFKNFDRFYSEKNHVQVCNVSHLEVDQWDKKFEAMQHSNTLTVSVHRGAWPQLTAQQQQQYQCLLIDRNITGAWQL